MGHKRSPMVSRNFKLSSDVHSSYFPHVFQHTDLVKWLKKQQIINDFSMRKEFLLEAPQHTLVENLMVIFGFLDPGCAHLLFSRADNSTSPRNFINARSLINYPARIRALAGECNFGIAQTPTNNFPCFRYLERSKRNIFLSYSQDHKLLASFRQPKTRKNANFQSHVESLDKLLAMAYLCFPVSQPRRF